MCSRCDPASGLTERRPRHWRRAYSSARTARASTGVPGPIASKSTSSPSGRSTASPAGRPSSLSAATFNATIRVSSSKTTTASSTAARSESITEGGRTTEDGSIPRALWAVMSAAPASDCSGRRRTEARRYPTLADPIRTLGGPIAALPRRTRADTCIAPTRALPRAAHCRATRAAPTRALPRSAPCPDPAIAARRQPRSARTCWDSRTCARRILPIVRRSEP